MTIRPARPDDAPAWCRLRVDLWPEGTSDEHAAEIADYFAGKGDPAVFVSVGPAGDLRGFVEVSIRAYAEGCATDRVGYVEGWYIAPEARRRGIGRALVAAAEGWARGRGCTEMASDVLLDNTVSQRAHLRLGYAEVERVVLYRKALT